MLFQWTVWSILGGCSSTLVAVWFVYWSLLWWPQKGWWYKDSQYGKWNATLYHSVTVDHLRCLAPRHINPKPVRLPAPTSACPPSLAPAMNFGTTVIFGLVLFITALLPDYSLASRIGCVECGHDAYERREHDYPRSGSCDERISATEVCRVTRTKMYYRCCNRRRCGAISVKNKQCPANKQEGCKHGTSKLYLKSGETAAPPSLVISPSQEASTSGGIPSEMIGDIQFFHFL
jgi:hypothetical protein